VGDHGEVGEVALYAGVKDGLGPGVAEGGPVLVQQVHQLFRNQPAHAKNILRKEAKKEQKERTTLLFPSLNRLTPSPANKGRATTSHTAKRKTHRKKVRQPSSCFSWPGEL
jgi:hypothetical protein